LDTFVYLDHVENITDLECQTPPPTLPKMETHPVARTLLSNYIAEPWEHGSQGIHETNLENNPYYQFAKREEYKNIQCGIKKKGMTTYYDNMLKEENTTLRFPRFKHEDGVQKLMASMPDDLDLGEWELHTLDDMKWNENHAGLIKYSS
jgi:hypothetical protein